MISLDIALSNLNLLLFSFMFCISVVTQVLELPKFQFGAFDVSGQIILIFENFL